MIITRNFHTLYELCDFIRQNNIDVFSKDVKYLGEYALSPTQSLSCVPVCYAVLKYNVPNGISSMSRPPKYTIHYEDNRNNVGPLDSHYVEDFSED